MTYLGEIHHGVGVLKDAPPLKEGTPVRVEVNLTASGLQRGNAEAVLEAMNNLTGSWANSAAEMDEALEYLRRTKLEEVRLQQAPPGPEL